MTKNQATVALEALGLTPFEHEGWLFSKSLSGGVFSRGTTWEEVVERAKERQNQGKEALQARKPPRRPKVPAISSAREEGLTRPYKPRPLEHCTQRHIWDYLND